VNLKLNKRAYLGPTQALILTVVKIIWAYSRIIEFIFAGYEGHNDLKALVSPFSIITDRSKTFDELLQSTLVLSC
jgi:hypothetical protein